MASKQMLVLAAAALAVAFLPALAAATEHWVGDDKGWTLGFNYSAWAQTKQFKVGDTLVFKYSEPSHTVVEVSGADFKTCTKPENSKVLTTGQDQVTLSEAGRRWFVCGVGAHCQNGMKVRIDVLAAEEAASGPSAPPPPASSPAAEVRARLAQAVLAVTAVIAAVLVF
ncbi:blue copper protein 1a-like [Panicum virgatum]|uniref:Phytocyanin domain-containing protein n=1 Tax=Panicum virgatum TaxID=38727 RepID=A0A8T0NE67_PANVG|nr:blue copper protein 1a-like [Panicum virgatum]KAG2545316.1 hypothetical protein PVAP13_9KG423929 [Panicum virgatum]